MCTCVSMIGGYPGYEGMVCVYVCQYDWRVGMREWCVCTCVSMIGGYPGYEGMVCVYVCQYDWRVSWV